jgi:hypothetical protein
MVGGQQLDCNCMFCGLQIASCGGQRIVEHLARTCGNCPRRVREPCLALQVATGSKRSMKAEHQTVVASA